MKSKFLALLGVLTLIGCGQIEKELPTFDFQGVGLGDDWEYEQEESQQIVSIGDCSESVSVKLESDSNGKVGCIQFVFATADSERMLDFLKTKLGKPDEFEIENSSLRCDWKLIGGGEAIYVADDGVESVSGGKGGTLLVCSGKYVDDMREYILEGELPIVGPAAE